MSGCDMASNPMFLEPPLFLSPG